MQSTRCHLLPSRADRFTFAAHEKISLAALRGARSVHFRLPRLSRETFPRNFSPFPAEIVAPSITRVLYASTSGSFLSSVVKIRSLHIKKHFDDRRDAIVTESN